MRDRAACTIATKESWALARVVAASFAEHHPDVPVLVLLADEPQGAFDEASEAFNVLELRDLGLASRSGLTFQ